MEDLNKYFFGESGVLIFSGEAERSGSYRVEAPGSNPIHRYDFSYFLIFSSTTFLGPHSVLINNNSKFKASYELTIIVNLEKRSCCLIFFWIGQVIVENVKVIESVYLVIMGGT